MSDADPGVRPADPPPRTATIDASERVTVVGVDLGVKRLVTAAPATAPPDVRGALTIDGGHTRDLFDALGDTLNRLDGQSVDTDPAATETVAR